MKRGCGKSQDREYILLIRFSLKIQEKFMNIAEYLFGIVE